MVFYTAIVKPLDNQPLTKVCFFKEGTSSLQIEFDSALVHFIRLTKRRPTWIKQFSFSYWSLSS